MKIHTNRFSKLQATLKNFNIKPINTLLIYQLENLSKINISV